MFENIVWYLHKHLQTPLQSPRGSVPLPSGRFRDVWGRADSLPFGWLAFSFSAWKPIKILFLILKCTSFNVLTWIDHPISVFPRTVCLFIYRLRISLISEWLFSLLLSQIFLPICSAPFTRHTNNAYVVSSLLVSITYIVLDRTFTGEPIEAVSLELA